MDGVALEFTEDALRALAAKTLSRKTGARGLRSSMEELLGDLMFTVPSDSAIEKVVITKEFVLGEKEPEIIRVPKAKAQ